MRGDNFHHKHAVYRALSPQSIATADSAVNGPWIEHPQRRGRQLTFIVSLGAIAASGSLTLNLQGRKRTDGSAVNLKEKDGTTDLEFTPASLDDGQDDTVLVGTVPLDDIDMETYDAIRLQADEDGSSSTVLVSAVAVISDAVTEPVGVNSDDLFNKVHTTAPS